MEMGTKENGGIQDDWTPPASPIEVLQQLSKEAVRMAGEAWQIAYSSNTPILEPPPRHRRTRSEAVSSFNRNNSGTGNFKRWKYQMQRASQAGGRRIESQYSFDPEILANQKRQWVQLNSKTSGPDTYKEPTSLFEHFVVVGPHPDAKLEVAEDSSDGRGKWEQETGAAKPPVANLPRNQRPTLPTFEPQVLFMYPPRKKLPLRLKDLAAFCFPGGVKARILERSPSLSELNELVYGQEHLCRDDLAFIFSLKVAGNQTLYGVCLQVHEVVQRPPKYGALKPLSQSLYGCNRFLVSAPRCFCILTRVPFFELHYEMLNSIIAQERLNRITKFVTEMALADDIHSPTTSNNGDENADSPDGESATDGVTSPIPVDCAITPAAAASIISDEEASCRLESPEKATASEASDHCQTRDMDKDDGKNVHAFDDSTSENSEIQSDGSNTPDVSSCIGDKTQSLERPRSYESLLSPAKSMTMEEDGETLNNHDDIPTNDMILQWARENKNDLLQIICGYHCLHLPERGSKIRFQPLEHLQSIEYQRPHAAALGLCDKYLDHKLKDSNDVSQVKLKLANAEEAASLSLWSTATICRVLSLDSILTLVTGVLLEKQILFFCPNLGVLSAVVLSLIPISRPFEWQSLFLPILPGKMLDFLDAPVPFIAGVQKKLKDMKNKTSDLIQVDIIKRQVNTCDLPQLPRRKELMSELAPFYSKLSREVVIARKQPVYKCNEVQAEAATQFLNVMRKYLESLCQDLRLHTITNVQCTDRVSILLKDSFIDSFPVKDRSFVKLFVETQLFTVLSDSQISSYENEYRDGSSEEQEEQKKI
ncbi:hypothetical protein ACS0TY_025311 [Phlomoides rotata]